MNQMTNDVTPDIEVKSTQDSSVDANSGATQASAGLPDGSAQGTQKWVAWIRESRERVLPAVSNLMRALKDVVLGGRSSSLITYGAYLLRLVGLILGALGVFAPIIESGSVGVVGWFVDLSINVILGFACFVLAEIALTIREIAETMKDLSGRDNGGYTIKDDESRSEGY